MNVQERVREIAKRVASEARQDPPWQEGAAEKSRQELEVLRGACLRLHTMSGAVGRMPPSPHTLRARAGGALIRCMQRALFWYTPSIVKFQNEAAHAIGSACDLLEIQQQQLAAQRRQMQELREEILRGRQDGTPSAERAP